MGIYETILMISVRTHNSQGGAGRLVQSVVCDRGTSGGHGTAAGGQIPLEKEESFDNIVAECRMRVLQYLDLTTRRLEGQPLFD